MDFKLRLANKKDEELILKWANQIDVRRNAIHTESISAENHKHWFQKKIKDPNLSLFVGIWNGHLVGQVRFDYHEGNYEIDYSVDQYHRGKGFGKLLIQLGMDAVKNPNSDKFSFIGLVRLDNLASQAVFRKLGFNEEEMILREGVPLKKFVFKKIF